jgi:hypothetical protein
MVPPGGNVTAKVTGRRRGAVFALALLTLLALLTPAAAVAKKPTPALAGTTVVSGSKAAGMLVRLDRPTLIRDPLTNEAGRGDVTVTGDGQFAGIALRAANAGPTPLTVVVGRLPQAMALKTRTFVLPLEGLPASANEYRLPAGDYWLYLLPGSGKTSVTLRLPELPGTARLTPDRRVPYQFADPKPSISQTTPLTVHTTGSESTTDRPSMTFFATFARYSSHVASQFHFCEYLGRPSSPAPYLPGCPSPTTEHEYTPFTISRETLDPSTVLVYGGHYGRPAGTYGDGVSITSPTAAIATGFFHLTMGLL